MYIQAGLCSLKLNRRDDTSTDLTLFYAQCIKSPFQHVTSKKKVKSLWSEPTVPLFAVMF